MSDSGNKRAMHFQNLPPTPSSESVSQQITSRNFASRCKSFSETVIEQPNSNAFNARFLSHLRFKLANHVTWREILANPEMASRMRHLKNSYPLREFLMYYTNRLIN